MYRTFKNTNWDKVSHEFLRQTNLNGMMTVDAPVHAILSVYAEKHGGIDKKDMLRVADMLKAGDKLGAVEYAAQLDTDPRDFLIGALVKD